MFPTGCITIHGHSATVLTVPTSEHNSYRHRIDSILLPTYLVLQWVWVSKNGGGQCGEGVTVEDGVQWNLRTTDALGAGLLSFVELERLSLSQRLALSKLAPRPRYVWLASSPGFPVWVRLLHCVQPKPR